MAIERNAWALRPEKPQAFSANVLRACLGCKSGQAVLAPLPSL
ncbi:MAG: hypothetical protein RLY32_1038 [Pseudomonadota bacterium]